MEKEGRRIKRKWMVAERDPTTWVPLPFPHSMPLFLHHITCLASDAPPLLLCPPRPLFPIPYSLLSLSLSLTHSLTHPFTLLSFVPFTSM
ncbi:hypothetical protein RIF29_10923 [Crotalaria pallida]|uniref:Uncharacterized protein n=1 Tax=Crotalaria pallida TaxID=3830 RepID=A0AAN9FWI5_CROPI